MSNNPYESPRQAPPPRPRGRVRRRQWVEGVYRRTFEPVLALLACSGVGVLLRFGPHMGGYRVELSVAIALALALLLSSMGFASGVAVGRMTGKSPPGILFHAFVLCICIAGIPLLLASWFLVR